jgi:hypothetical protein
MIISILYINIWIYLRVRLENDSKYFAVQVGADQLLSHGKDFDLEAGLTEEEDRGQVCLTVRPIVRDIPRNYENRIGKFIVDHLILYNREQISEKYVITMRLYIGSNGSWLSKPFYLAPYNKNSHAYGILEERILKLLSGICNCRQFFHATVRSYAWLDEINAIQPCSYICVRKMNCKDYPPVYFMI